MVRYKMVGRDFNSNPTQYRTWVVPNCPDFNAQFYTGYKSGSNNFIDVNAYAIDDNNVIADFNLPIPTGWVSTTSNINVFSPIKKILPTPVEDAQLAVLDGYIYLFGGKVTNKIYRATVNNPADWVDCGATLPSPLYGSSLAIVDGYIYLFGGNNGSGTTNAIFSAPVSNPLSWTDDGYLLPQQLQYSNLGMFDGYIYLFGGQEIKGATNVIFSASTSNPLVWSNTGIQLPTPVYGSIFSQIDGYWMIFGGIISGDIPTSEIWSASINNPTSWSVSGSLPYATAFGQFVNISGDGYIFGPMNGVTTGFTSILQCNLANPNVWSDTQKVISGSISHSHLAIVYDRIWLFGGSGEVGIFACDQEIKYNLYDPRVLNYANITRVIFPTTDNLDDPLQALGIPWWRTDYPFSNRS